MVDRWRLQRFAGDLELVIEGRSFTLDEDEALELAEDLREEVEDRGGS